MKKLILSAAAAVLSVCAAQAQTPVKYQGEVDLGYSIGVGTFGTGRVNLHTVQGVKVGRHFSTGLGQGFDLYHEGATDLILPIYVNFKGYLPVSEKVAPYLSLDIGGGIGLTENLNGLSGLCLTPAVGIRAGMFKAQLGYNIQQLSELGASINFNAIQIKVGVVF